MKKFFILLLFVFLSPVSVMAACQIKVSAIEEFHTDAPKDKLDVKIKTTEPLGENLLEENDILHCSVLRIEDPKRGKRDATFYVKPESYTNISGYTIKINQDYYGKYSKRILSVEELKQIPPSTILKKTALTVGNHFVKGLSTGVSFAEGVIENNDNNRLKSGAIKAYEDSPLSYVEKGEQINISKGDEFYLIFKLDETSEVTEDKPNYSYTLPVD